MTDRTNETLRMSETLNAMMEAVVAELAITRALLAQRDAELEALREKVGRVQNEAQRIYDMGTVSVYESAQEIGEIFLAALSDNQESPALTDKEEQ